MGGGEKGGKKGGGGEASNPAADAQMRMAEELFKQSGPIRGSLMGRSENFLNGGMNVTDTPTFLAYKQSADQLFNKSKDNAIARTPSGGALTSALTNLEGQRASSLTQGAGAIYGDELSRAMSLGTGGSGQALNSLGQAGAIQAQMAAANSQEKAGKYGALGSGVGAYMGSK
jgi:hypothetical protein